MSGFWGRFDYSIDSKGRLNIPAKFRKAMSPAANETFVVTRAHSGCLRAFPEDEWNLYSAELFGRPENAGNLKLKRIMADATSDSKLDVAGRISINQNQIKLANIRNSIVLVGQGKFIEIWDAEKYTTYQSSITQDDFDKLYEDSVSMNPKPDSP
jgi:MraZ protein